jgi:hypothetical protein
MQFTNVCNKLTRLSLARLSSLFVSKSSMNGSCNIFVMSHLSLLIIEKESKNYDLNRNI